MEPINVDIDLLDVDEDAPDFIVQGTVVIVQGRRFIVEKRAPVNYKLRDKEHKRYNFPRDNPGIKRAKNQHWEGERVDEYSTIVRQLEIMTLKPGAVVEFVRPDEARKWPGHYVIANVGPKNYRLHQLGGDGTNAYVSAPPECIRVVQGAWVPNS